MATSGENVIIGGRLYNLGNDYPSDIGCRPVDPSEWVASSYLDGIYTEAASGFVTGGWNKYFNTVLPQEEWDAAESGRAFPDQYAVAYLALEKDHNETVKEKYPSEGIDAIADDTTDTLTAWKGGSPYVKKPITEIVKQ